MSFDFDDPVCQAAIRMFKAIQSWERATASAKRAMGASTQRHLRACGRLCNAEDRLRQTAHEFAHAKPKDSK